MKIICYGVREIERSFFNQLNIFQYELTLINEYMNHTTVELADGYDAVMIRGNCLADEHVLDRLKSFGIKYILTRTVGYNHINLEYARILKFELCARVPQYSPTAVSELAVSMALMLSRKTLMMLNQTRQKDFVIHSQYFAKEIRHSTVGIIGMGNIGQASAKAFIGLGAKVIASTLHPSEQVKKIVDIVELNILLQQADIVLLHMPYNKESNHHFVNSQFISKMKDNAILINTSRGELVDINAIIDALHSQKLSGVGLDVLENETSYFGKNCQMHNDILLNKLIELYPRLIITPHLGSFTDEALCNMILTSYQNLHDFLTTNQCNNCLL